VNSFFSPLIAEWRRIILPPLVPWAVCFCLGVAVQAWLGLSLFILGAGVFISCLAVCLLTRRPGYAQALLFAAGFFLGALHFGQAMLLPQDDVRRLIPQKKARVTLEGRVASEPFSKGRATTFVLDVDRFLSGKGLLKVRGRLWVRSSFGEEACECGDRLVVTGNLYRPLGPLKEILARQKIGGVLSVPQGGSIERRKAGPRPWQAVTPPGLKKRAMRIFREFCEPGPAGLFEAMILGESRRMPGGIKQEMVRTGTWHIMVVSGSHTAFVAYLSLLVLKILRVPRKPRFILAAISVVLYCFMTGASSPVVRATIMTLAVMASFMSERNPMFFNALSFSGLVILLFDPAALFDVGFQLSYLSVFFIVNLTKT